ncbi:MAG TPA: NUDIX hydrolase [Bradyrhizobium sp.]|nr:NUDIX hydrolase [Bradyrhizobium sp.]
MTVASIRRVTTLELRYEPRPWPFAEARRAEISAHFAEKQREKPAIWNGRVLLARDPVLDHAQLSARYFDADFASFLAWRDWGFPDKEVFNGFGMGALRSSDGAFVLGEMNQHTANAGRIYFPAGTPEPGDIRDGAVDLAGSVLREMEEETGLRPDDYSIDPGWYCVRSGAAIALLRLLVVDCPGEELKDRIEANLASQTRPELAAIHLVRETSELRGELGAAMPRYVTAFIEHQLGSE